MNLTVFSRAFQSNSLELELLGLLGPRYDLGGVFQIYIQRWEFLNEFPMNSGSFLIMSLISGLPITGETRAWTVREWQKAFKGPCKGLLKAL
jgi:hypothetical protein